ncbi:nicotinate-nucleotide--dimethylbenzimidazole phosphoribosyltransferase [Desulfuribacillus stibiiarsenatis]|uniref:Nicotinate-nucleotide--dimethylbenzimidazole phosphoribosyltransferase n=1 Tax=Desulfuribacillus stibiiarsenatis TaxID=1390249 RepID=A0A1E5L2P9_9FIRM|nr:nicotinate-nucleotide--dimethylbenzimidazole phosphoribosyltransferase [Desulfuribacillus stibiiarsenatis]OEH84398.1 nicotinate-nucleotide--dimethylbenzimidazole phosphoribosyltransferase [Desulfuribacillus stibiiarsenatis]
MNLENVLESIKPLDKHSMDLCKTHLDSLTKPIGSLGVLEDLAIQISGITMNSKPIIKQKQAFVFAADHGITEEGVSAFPQEVTKQMVLNFINGGAAINVLARKAQTPVTVVDIGVNGDLIIEGLVQCKVAHGTKNFSKEPAMTREQAILAIETGILLTTEAINRGVDLFIIGEMGIGNTTSSSAIVTALTNAPLEDTVGCGTGISTDSLQIKRSIIKTSLEKHKPNANDGLDVLSKIGGLEIAGMVGVILACAANRRPVILDGFISGAAALIAQSLSPLSVSYMIPSHSSVEPGHRVIYQKLTLHPFLHMNMRLGEGTGAALAIHVIESSLQILHEMATFADAGVSNKNL